MTRPTAVVLGACWTVIAVSLVILLASLPGLPAAVPVFVSMLNGTPTAWAPTSIPMVMRIALMGAGQLVVVHALADQSTRTDRAGWTRFFEWLAGALAAKTLFESVMLASTGTAWGVRWALTLHALTLAIVVTFLVAAAIMWRRGQLSALPATISPMAGPSVAVGLAVWLACATIPYWYRG